MLTRYKCRLDMPVLDTLPDALSTVTCTCSKCAVPGGGAPRADASAAQQLTREQPYAGAAVSDHGGGDLPEFYICESPSGGTSVVASSQRDASDVLKRGPRQKTFQPVQHPAIPPDQGRAAIMPEVTDVCNFTQGHLEYFRELYVAGRVRQRTVHYFPGGNDPGPSREVYLQVNDDVLPLQCRGRGYQVSPDAMQTRVSAGVGSGLTVEITAVTVTGEITALRFRDFGEGYSWGDVVEISHPPGHALNEGDVATFRVSWWLVNRVCQSLVNRGEYDERPEGGMANGSKNPFVVVHVHYVGSDLGPPFHPALTEPPDFSRVTCVNVRWSWGVNNAATAGRYNPLLGRSNGQQAGAASKGLNITGKRGECGGLLASGWSDHRYTVVTVQTREAPWDDSIHGWWERSSAEAKAEFVQRFCAFAERIEPRLASGKIGCSLVDLNDQPEDDYNAAQRCWTVRFKVDAWLSPNWQNELRYNGKFEGFHGVGMRVGGEFRPAVGKEGWRFCSEPIPAFPATAAPGRGDVPIPGPPTQELLKRILVNVDNLVKKLKRSRPYHVLATEHVAIYQKLSDAHVSGVQARIDAAEREWAEVRASLEKRGGASFATAVHADDALHAAHGTIVFRVADLDADAHDQTSDVGALERGGNERYVDPSAFSNAVT
jgi:hypothetical protein